MMKIKNPKGLLLLDMVGTFGSMDVHLAVDILGWAIKEKFQAVIVPHNDDRSSIGLHFLLSNFPHNMIPDIRTNSKKDSPAFYGDIAKEYGVNVDQILLIDDASENTACAEESGARGLLYEGAIMPPSGRRYIKGRKAGEGKLAEDREPILDALDIVLTEMTNPSHPKRPATKAKTAISKSKPVRKTARKKTNQRPFTRPPLASSHDPSSVRRVLRPCRKNANKHSDRPKAFSISGYRHRSDYA